MRYITRTIESYDTEVTFVTNNEITKFKLTGEIGKKEAKKKLIELGFENTVVISVNKVIKESHLYRMKEEDFIKNAEIIEKE